MKISIITVCLNSEKTIEQTIQSVITQNYDDYEYIIIDGKSIDKTLEIVNKYKENISIIISEPDSGIYDAMNKGIELAGGDIIGIINSDDWYEPEVFKIVSECFQKTNAEVVYGKVNVIAENGDVNVVTPGDIKNIRYEMIIPHCTAFVKKDIYRRYGLFELEYEIAADYELMLRLYTKGIRFTFLDKELANFRLGGVSIRQIEKSKKEEIAIAQRYINHIPLMEREDCKKIITHRCRVICFKEMLNTFPDILVDVLAKRKYDKLIDDIAIFGAGKWGIKVYNILKKNGIEPLFFVDNDKEKWNRKEEDILILSPEKLRWFSGFLLIVVKNFGEDILHQITQMGNSQLHCITWEEIADDYVASLK